MTCAGFPCVTMVEGDGPERCTSGAWSQLSGPVGEFWGGGPQDQVKAASELLRCRPLLFTVQESQPDHGQCLFGAFRHIGFFIVALDDKKSLCPQKYDREMVSWLFVDLQTR